MGKETSEEEGEQTPERTYTPTPYDAFYKAAFADSQSAADLIRNFLPESYSHRIEGMEVSVDIKDYINRYLTEHQSDLLVTCRNTEGQEFHFYFLYEHKSSPERSTLLLLARAIIELTFDLLGKQAAEEEDEVAGQTDATSDASTEASSSEENRKKWRPAALPVKNGKAGSRWLPEIIPVILYHGSPPWNYPTQFSEQIDSIDRYAKHLLRFEPFFIRLQDYRDDQFTGSLKTVVGLMVLKYLSRTLDGEAARKLVETMNRENPVPLYLREFYDKCYRVLSQVKKEKEYELLLGELKKAGYTKEKERAMTYAEAAEKKGKEEGRIEGEHNTLIRLLNRKFGLSEEEEELVRSTVELEKIEAALDEILEAETKEQVFAHLK